jgi:hypothetical protein
VLSITPEFPWDFKQGTALAVEVFQREEKKKFVPFRSLPFPNEARDARCGAPYRPLSQSVLDQTSMAKIVSASE